MLDVSSLIEYIRKSLRIEDDDTFFDNEIEVSIRSCIIDLEKFCKVRILDIEDDFIKTTITVYVKAYFGIENKDMDKNLKLYERLKLMLSRSAHYTDTYQNGGE